MLELGLSAQRIYQDLVAGHGFGGSYPSVRRYVAKLKASEPERVWRIECQPGEEMQVDFGLGAPLVEAGGNLPRTLQPVPCSPIVAVASRRRPWSERLAPTVRLSGLAYATEETYVHRNVRFTRFCLESSPPP